MGFPLSFKQKKEAIKPTGFILMNLVSFTIGHMLKPVFKIFISHFSEINPDPAMEELPFTIFLFLPPCGEEILEYLYT